MAIAEITINLKYRLTLWYYLLKYIPRLAFIKWLNNINLAIIYINNKKEMEVKLSNI
jgi:hypothetical protein